LEVWDGKRIRALATRGLPASFEEVLRRGVEPGPDDPHWRLVDGASFFHFPDQAVLEGQPTARKAVELAGLHTVLGVPLRKDGTLLGRIVTARAEVRPFTDKEIALLQNFAAQAVIAIENARLLGETREALEQQTATAEVLQVINASPGNLEPVFEVILEKAHSLCGAAKGAFVTFDGQHFQVAATRGLSDAYTTILQSSYPDLKAGYRVGEQSPREQLLNGADLIHLTGSAVAVGPVGRAAAELEKIRALLFLPLRRDGALLGYITAYGMEESTFCDKQIALLKNFAAQAVIAMENARLMTETREALEQQTATAEVLRVINASPGDLAPVFDAILEKAHALCGARDGALVVREGDNFRAVATHGSSEQMAAMLSQPFPPYPGGSHERLLQGERLIHIPDQAASEQTNPIGRASVLGGTRTLLFIPLRKDGTLLGYITAARREVRPFSEKEITLLENFAAQAVIAMENARLITETREALEQQTATADVLGVINSSPGDLAPVFDAMLEKAIRLCGGIRGVLWTFEGERGRVAASRGLSADFVALLREHGESGTNPMLQRVMRGEHLFQINVPEHELYRSGDPLATAAFGAGVHTLIWVALVREGVAVGAFAIGRSEVRRFSDKEIALLQNFAAQAVIAMENARLLTETREALEQQTATAEVLRVINASPGDLVPVFEAILEKAHNLCAVAIGALEIWDGERVRAVATRGLPREFDDLIRQGYRPEPNDPHWALVDGRRFVHVPNLGGVDDPTSRTAAALVGTGTFLAVALRKDDTLLGRIVAARQEVRPFADKEIALLESFAAQAVIAMENARLLTELRLRTEELARRNSEYGERIEQQAATIDVLKVMSASPGDAQPVFQLIVERACAFCNADQAHLALVDHDILHLKATIGAGAAYPAQFPRPVDATSLFGRAIFARDTVQTPDVRTDPEHFRRALPEDSVVPVRAGVSVPLLHGGTPVGAIGLGRNVRGEFSATQVELLQTFAEQAVIAIRSAETYRELQERTAALAQRNSEYGERIEQQTATIDVLKAMSASPDDTQPVFDQIVSRAQELCNGWRASLFEFDGELVHHRAYTNANIPELEVAAYLAAFPMAPTRGSITCRAILDRQTIHIRDMDAETVMPAVRGLLHKSQLTIPLLRDNVAIGAITLAARERGGFSDSQVALLQTFAEQAVIAITSVANFRALRVRTAELTRSVAELQALEEVLRAVNSSLELETVLSTIISRAVQLSGADEGTVYEFDDAEQVFVPKSAYGMTAERVAALRDRRIRMGDETPLGRCAAMRAPLHVSDLTQTLDIDGSRTLVADGIHALLAVPLLRDDKVLGGLVIRRRAIGGFAPTVLTLLQTFAGQCVLAIENARLFQEARRARVEAETTLADLRRTQDRLVQSEKMASLGQLTAGIAHEIKNPLNFVNNFSELSVDLLDELHDAVAPDRLAVADGLRTEIDELTAMLKGNLEKIAEHGRRADSIVKNMLLHSRSGPGEHRLADLNATVEEALSLAYHGARAATPGFNITMETRLDPRAGKVHMYPQEITRVLLNLIGNGFYAAHKRAEASGNDGFEPTLQLTTRDLGDQVEIRVRDNGTGISEAARDRIFEPFFTTKPAGEGTGLGLSISYDIITQQHGGSIIVESEPGSFTEFTVRLPRQ
jgi:GAF domain-containing protein